MVELKYKMCKGGADMDPVSIGNKITEYRKKQGLTQLALAKMLDVSDKAVSKWENGQSFPDVTLFPRLANLFGVSVDELMNDGKNGIAIAGNIIADVVKNIDVYPEKGMLAYISDIDVAVGGCVPNTAIDLAKIDRRLPIYAYGKIGADEYGRYILSQLQKHGINTDGIQSSKNSATSFCDVMSMPSGERTFFNKKGANSEFSPEDIDIDALNCSIFHIGYILLLDVFDAFDEEYGTVMARFLSEVQKRGIKTSVDVVSDSTADYGKKIIPVLKFLDYAIMNELECCRTWELEPYNPDGGMNKDNVRAAMEKMAQQGVREKIIVHSKETSFLLDIKTNEFIEVKSFKIPKEDIKGSVGAGDAFCAGALYGIYNDYANKAILEFASSSAVCSLFAANSVDGMRPRDEVLEISKKYGRLE